MSHRLVRPVAVACLALALGFGLLPRLVLCIGSDGHHAIEPMNAACCDRAAHATNPDVHAPQDGCAAGCIDTPLTVGQTLTRDRTHAVPPALSAVVSVALAPALEHPVTGQRRLSAHGVRSQLPPRILRTTIARC
jgi:hypothetical protein